MLKWLAVILCLSVSHLAGAMTWDQRQQLKSGIEATIATMENKYLPAKLVKNSLAKASGGDATLMKEVFADWPKHYSKSMRYQHLGDGIQFFYQDAPVLKMRVTSLDPYTVVLNDRTEAVLAKGEMAAAMKKALRQEGFGEKKGAWLALFPEAVAEDGQPARTFENSAIVAANYIYESATETTRTLVQKGFLLPDTRNGFAKKIASRDETLSCDGENAAGMIADTDGATMNFTASREKGIEIKDTGVTIKGAVGSVNSPVCDELAKMGEDKDGMTFDKLIDSNRAESAKTNFILSQMDRSRGQKMKACIEQEIKQAQTYLQYGQEHQTRPPAPYPYRGMYQDPRAYYGYRAPARNREPYVSGEIRQLLRNKCEFEYMKSKRTEEYKAEYAALKTKAEEDWAANSARVLRQEYTNNLAPILSACRALNHVKPALKLSCATPNTVGEAKKFCGEVRNAGITAPKHLEACFADGECSTLGGDHLSSVRASLATQKKYHDAVLKFKTDYAKYFPDTLKEENGVVRIANPNGLSGKDLEKISAEIAKLSDLKGLRPERALNMDSPTLYTLVSGAMGLLDCCHDIECKKTLIKSGINLEPKTKTPTTAH